MRPYQIEIAALKLFGRHGALEEEEKLGQFFLLDLQMEAIEPSTDDPRQMLDYGAVALEVQRLFLEKRFLLIESLAQHILGGLASFSGLRKAKLRIAKPNPPIPLPLGFVAVTLEREY